MSIRVSEGGRLFGIMAGLGGAAMMGAAALVWKKGFFAKPNGNGYGIILRGGTPGRIMLLVGLVVIAGAVTFIGVESRRIRITAAVVMVLAGVAGIMVLTLSADPRALASWVPARCTRSNPADAPCIEYLTNGSGTWLAILGCVLATGYGILALVRSGWEPPSAPAVEQPVATASDAAPIGDVARLRIEPPMSDTQILGWTVGLVVVALALYSCAMFFNALNENI